MVVVGWGGVLVATAPAQTWRTVLDVIVLAAAHLLAAVVALRHRRPGAPGAAARTALTVGLGAFATAALGGRLIHTGTSGIGTWVLDVLHLIGQLGIGAVLISLVLPTRGRIVIAGMGLDALSTALGVSAVAGSIVVLAIGDSSADLATGVMLALTSIDVALVAGAVALLSVLRPGRGSAVPLLLAGAILVLAADLTSVSSPTRGGPASPTTGLWLTAAACLLLATAATRPAPTTADTSSTAATNRPLSWSTALPFVGIGVTLIAVSIDAVTPLPDRWALLPVLAAAGCLAVVALRFTLTVGVARSVLEQLEDALSDPLTGLLNRRGLSRTLDRWLADGKRVSLVAVDLDGFRRINEEAGHEVGDRVLRRVADQLSALAGPHTLVARIDGDDFALAFLGEDPVRASMLTRTTRDVLGRPAIQAHRRFHLTANVGTIISHDMAIRTGTARPTTDDLLRCADQTLAEAQASTGGSAVHDPARCSQIQEDSLLAWVDDLHAALAADDQLLLHFQPQHQITGTGTGTGTGTVATVVGCEALLRWEHPTRGLLGPGEVLRAAEHGHLAAAVTDRVLDLALGGAACWWHDRKVPVAVNLGATDLDELLPHRIADALDRHGLPARALTVEVVEDTLMLDPDRALQTLTALRSIGLRIAVDDYGTGYSSLAYLHRLPIDEVKFDRSLTAGISADPAAAVIVEHSIRLAHDLGLSALAEGIEQPEDLDLLLRLGCDAVQGYLTGRPQALTTFITTLTPGQDPHKADLRIV